MYALILKNAHRIAGVLIALGWLLSPVVSLVGVYFYVKYQTQEYKQISDTCYQDIKEALVPFFVTVALLLILSVFNKRL